MIHWEEARSALGPQKWKRGNGAERLGEFVVQVGRPGVAVGFLAAVGVVDGAGGHGPVGVRAHRVPPADVGDGVAGVRAAGGVPQLVAADQRVVLPPEQDLAQLAEVPAVADDAVLGGGRPGEEGRLGGAGDGGQHGAERARTSRRRRGRESRGIWVSRRGVRPTTSRTSRRGRGWAPGAVVGLHGSSLRPRSVSRSRARASSAAMPSASRARVRGPQLGGQGLPGVRLHLQVAGAAAPVRRPGGRGSSWRTGRVEVSGGCGRGVQRDVEVGRARARSSGSAPACERLVEVVGGRAAPLGVAGAGLVQEARLGERRRGRSRTAARSGCSACSAAESWDLTTGTPAAVSAARRVVRVLERRWRGGRCPGRRRCGGAVRGPGAAR